MRERLLPGFIALLLLPQTNVCTNEVVRDLLGHQWSERARASDPLPDLVWGKDETTTLWFGMLVVDVHIGDVASQLLVGVA